MEPHTQRIPGILNVCPPPCAFTKVQRTARASDIRQPKAAWVRDSHKGGSKHIAQRTLQWRRLGLIPERKESSLKADDSLSIRLPPMISSNILGLASKALNSEEFPPLGSKPKSRQQGMAHQNEQDITARIPTEECASYDFRRERQSFDHISKRFGDPRPVVIKGMVKEWLDNVEEGHPPEEQKRIICGLDPFWLL